jgi:hypothetical protein
MQNNDNNEMLLMIVTQNQKIHNFLLASNVSAKKITISFQENQLFFD